MTDASISGSLTDLLRDQVTSFAGRNCDHKRTRALRNTLPGYDQDLARKMAELGWYGTLVSEIYGGVGLSLREMGVLIEALGRSLLAEPMIGTAVLAARALQLGDNEDVKRRFLPELARGALFATVAWQETAGFDPSSCTTKADGQGRLSGKKLFVRGGAGADGVVVSASDGDEVRLYWVDSRGEGVSWKHAWQADGTPCSSLVLDSAPAVTLTRTSGGLPALRRVLDEAMLMVAAEQVGVMTSALEITLEYMRTRVQFDRPIGSFQALQHKAVDLYTQKELAAAALAGALNLCDGQANADEFSRVASRVKARASDAGMLIARESIQLHGAIGFTDECDIGLYLKRALVLAGSLGNAETHRRRVAAIGLKPVVDDSAARRVEVPAGVQDWNAVPDEEFRAIAATVFDECCPKEIRFLPQRQRWSVTKPLYEALSARGWLAPAWPISRSGMGLSPSKLILYFEEWGRLGLPRLADQGINNVAAVIISRGTEEQQQYYLPRILSGEHRWCQGYSEPNAGSDLASLRTEARVDGNEFVVNGSKIWTTMAMDATHIYALVRTDKTVKKQAGLSFILMDMNQPGITVRPIRNLSGGEEFCEVFLDNARTPVGNLVGKLNEGWTVAKTLLGFERNKEGSPRQCRYALQRLERVADALGLTADPLFRDRLIQLHFDVADQGALYERFAQAVRGGAMPAYQVSMMKVWASETLQRVTEALVDAIGSAGSVAGMQQFGEISADVVTPFLDTRAFTIFGGTNQVQRNILAKQVLNLGR